MSISLDNIVDVSVEVSTPASISSDFNLGLIIGKSKHLVESKVKVYDFNTYASQMTADGFTTGDAEYKAVQVYFSQSPRPDRVAVGAINTSGLETPAKAFEGIRALNKHFYSVCYAFELTDEEVENVAKAVEAAATPTVFYYSSKDAKCVGSEQTNIMKKLKDGNYSRSVGFYSNDVMISAAVVGLVSGLNSLDTNSAYTLSYKSLVGVKAEAVNEAQLKNLISYNGNIYTNFGNSYKFVYPAITATSLHVDEIFLIDVASFMIQQKTVSGLFSMKKVPQTEDGVNTIVSFVSSACEKLNDIGLISGGIWTGEKIMGLDTGDAVADGYLIQSGKIYDQTAEERASRISPPIYVALLASGALEHIVIRVFVNR